MQRYERHAPLILIVPAAEDAALSKVMLLHGELMPAFCDCSATERRWTDMIIGFLELLHSNLLS